MTLTIDLSDEQESALKAKAKAQGLSAEQYAARVLEMDLSQTVAGMSPEENARDFVQWATSHRHTPRFPMRPLAAPACTRTAGKCVF